MVEGKGTRPKALGTLRDERKLAGSEAAGEA